MKMHPVELPRERGSEVGRADLGPCGVDVSQPGLSCFNPNDSMYSTIVKLRWLLTSLQQSGVLTLRRLPRPASPPPSISTRTPAQEPSPGRDERPCLNDIALSLAECCRCRLHTGRTHLVFGEGAPDAELVFVGEGPGFDEDRQGRPFVGRAGKLLDKMILAIRLKREDVYICNAVKCRPPENRTPSVDEIEICSPFLFQQLEAIRPKVICALGLCAAQTLLGKAPSMGQLRRKTFQWRGIPLICTYHPAYLLRNPIQKCATWQDLLEVRRILCS
jgi:uracil-DNA glycosylase